MHGAHVWGRDGGRLSAVGPLAASGGRLHAATEQGKPWRSADWASDYDHRSSSAREA